MDESRTILVVDDDNDIRRALRVLLQRAGYEVCEAADARSALRALYERHPQLVILDVALPDLDGSDVLARIREITDVPVIMLSGRTDETHKVRALRAGADDYMTKPFSNAELVARVYSVLRRRKPAEEKYDDGRLRIDYPARLVYVDGRPVQLTSTEWNVLVELARHRNNVVSPDELLARAWNDPDGVGRNRVKFTVLRLRKRLGWEDPATSPIEAVRGFGYRYRVPV